MFYIFINDFIRGVLFSECVIKKLTNTDKDTNEVIKCIKNACLWKDGKGKQLQLMKQINGETIQKPKKVKGIGWKRQYLKPSYPEEGLTQWNKFKKLKKLLKT